MYYSDSDEIKGFGMGREMAPAAREGTLLTGAKGMVGETAATGEI